MQLAGWGLGLTGGALVAVGASLNNDRLGTAFLASGGAMAGLGILSFVFGITADEAARWHLQVSGDVVQSRTPPAESAGSGFRPEL